MAVKALNAKVLNLCPFVQRRLFDVKAVTEWSVALPSYVL